MTRAIALQLLQRGLYLATEGPAHRINRRAVNPDLEHAAETVDEDIRHAASYPAGATLLSVKMRDSAPRHGVRAPTLEEVQA
jgi:cytochrome P450